MTKLGPFVINARSGKVHHRHPRCRYAGRVLAEPLLIEATTTYEACQQIVERGLDPCIYCFPWRERLDPGRRYIARERRSSESSRLTLWQIVDTTTNEVVSKSGSARWAVNTEKEWNEALERDPEFTPRRYEAKRRLQLASSRRRYAESQWQNAIGEMHEAGFSLPEIAVVAGVDPSDIAALITAHPSSA